MAINYELSAELKDKTLDPEEVTGKDIRLKKICFKPAPSFKKGIEDQVNFHKTDSRKKRY